MPRFNSNDAISIEKRKDLDYSETMKAEEIDDILTRASRLSYMGLNGDAWEALFSTFWAFGKRVSEVVELRTTDIQIRGDDLAVTFSIRKKRGGVRPRRTKRLTLDNKYAQIIKQYWESIKEEQLFMFPAMRVDHIPARYVWDVLHNELGLEQPVWSHLFRHSLATELASDEVSAFEMKTWFDWERIDTADEYVSASGVGTEKISGRKW